MAAARPIVASVGGESEVARVVEESQAGVVVPPEEPASLAEAILRLHRDSALAARMGRAGRVYARVHWERETVLKSTEQVLTSALNNEREFIRLSMAKTRV
jgi:colanic acid biosynthesis glycosyl transferase WcaI